MGNTLDDYAPKRAEEWLETVHEYFQGKGLIYQVETREYDDMDDEIHTKLLKMAADGKLNLEVYVSVKVWNANLKHMIDEETFGTPEVRFYEDVAEGKWHSIAEFERSFNYE